MSNIEDIIQKQAAQIRLLQDKLDEYECSAIWRWVNPEIPVKDFDIGRKEEVLDHSGQMIHKSEDGSTWLDIFERPVPIPTWILSYHRINTDRRSKIERRIDIKDASND
jgi:hypothetical protein